MYTHRYRQRKGSTDGDGGGSGVWDSSDDADAGGASGCVLGKSACESAYRSGDAWLIKTDHADVAEWLRVYEVQPRAKGQRRKRAAERDEEREEGEAPGAGGAGELFDVMAEPEECETRETRESSFI